MQKSELLTPRINLKVPFNVSILIDKEADKRKITRTQYIREAIAEKLERIAGTENDQDIDNIRDNLKELRIITLAILDKLNATK